MTTKFINGEESSAGRMRQLLEEVRDTGSEVLETLDDAALKALIEFDRRLSAMNSRSQRANRVLSPGTVARLVVSDFIDIDQSKTTATVRADVQAATLKERSLPEDATVREIRFSSDLGSSEQLDSVGSIFQVYATRGSIPTGTFEVELVSSVGMALVVFDIAASPSTPTVTVSASTNGISYSDALAVSVSGYRVSAWFNPMAARFVRIAITPSHPDNLTGSTYTFGLTSFSVDTLDFHLRSELLSRPVSFAPRTPTVKFATDSDDGLTYFLAICLPGAEAPFVEVEAGDTVALPGIVALTPVSVGFTGVNGVLNHSFPSTAYVDTLVITDDADDSRMRVAPGLSATDPNIAKLDNTYMSVVGTTLRMIPYDNGLDASRTFTVSYTTGPSLLQVQLRVVLSTEDRTHTPVFRGARLEEI